MLKDLSQDGSLRTAAFPTWFSWVSALVAIGLLTPLACIVLAFAVVWLLVVSICSNLGARWLGNRLPVLNLPEGNLNQEWEFRLVYETLI